MVLQEGAVYRTPDGRRMQASADVRRFDGNLAWTLAPTDMSVEADSFTPTRDRLSGMLFVEDGKLYQFDFAVLPSVKDTGWTIADLIKER